jgi:hypothetical protein
MLHLSKGTVKPSCRLAQLNLVRVQLDSTKPLSKVNVSWVSVDECSRAKLKGRYEGVNG